MLIRYTRFSFKTLFIISLIFLFFTLVQLSISFAERLDPLPKLNDAVKSLAKIYQNKDMPFLIAKEYQLKKLYYQAQSKTQKLKILEEVKEHFERAAENAEEKFDLGEEGISQSSITKLKLGLAQTMNDIIELKSEVKNTRLSLSLIFKDSDSQDREISDSDINPVEFNANSYNLWFSELGLSNNSVKEKSTIKDRVSLQMSFLKVEETKEKLGLAKQNRKITRALLVSEVANYDFGIGNPEDLFEALIIYTRVLSGYYDSVYNFNTAVADLNRLTALFLRKL